MYLLPAVRLGSLFISCGSGLANSARYPLTKQTTNQSKALNADRARWCFSIDSQGRGTGVGRDLGTGVTRPAGEPVEVGVAVGVALSGGVPVGVGGGGEHGCTP